VIPLNYSKKQAKINITGRVQGVGFRPFVYRMAVKNRLFGYVINLGDAGVEIVVEGSEKNLDKFIRDIKRKAPKVSEIEKIRVRYSDFTDKFSSFEIEKSQISGQVASGIYPPDISICPECLNDMENPNGRWYNYSFTACAWCGPRFTSVKALPYDRERTHMNEFPMCNNCDQDYNDPLDRRFDAQGITCAYCGPKMRLYNNIGNEILVENIFKEIGNYLNKGKIIAIKGIGGIHLTSLATSDKVINEFRKRKDRDNQPFALMSPNLEAVKLFAQVNNVEERYLTSWRKPIVLLKKNNKIISELVAPGLDTVGVMLPYTGIQTMIFKYLDEPAIVMTSGNRRGLPIVIKNENARIELEELADYFLLHDRDIINRSDDSVLRIINEKPAFIRRSRGYVPESINSPIKKGVALALGAELRNSAALATKGKIYLTQYLGDISSLEGLEFEKSAIKTMRDLLNITCNPDVIACDLHPDYLTSHYGQVISQEYEVPLYKSQHHHAHITSVMTEHEIMDDEVIGIALDGAGYGQDRQIWGGEILKSTYIDYERVGQLEYLPMPGGDLCAYYPYRMLISALTKSASDEEIRDITKNHINHALPHKEKEFSLILNQARNINILKTSSFGRVLDSVSSMLELTYYRSYEGEPAMRLESLAARGNPNKIIYSPIIENLEGKYVLNTSNMLYYLFNNKNNYKKQDIAAFSQKYLSDGIVKIVLNIAQDTGISIIALSGGVFVNDYITSYITKEIEKEDFTVIRNTLVPPGDGGVALGQVASALHHVI
jgi:hydrogenase maturation protein HypF